MDSVEEHEDSSCASEREGHLCLAHHRYHCHHPLLVLSITFAPFFVFQKARFCILLILNKLFHNPSYHLYAFETFFTVLLFLLGGPSAADLPSALVLASSSGTSEVTLVADDMLSEGVDTSVSTDCIWPCE